MANTEPVYVVQYFDPGQGAWYLAGVFDDKDMLDDWICSNLPEECTISTFPLFMNHPTPYLHTMVHQWKQ